MSWLLTGRHTSRSQMGKEANCSSLPMPTRHKSIHHWWLIQNVRRRYRWRIQEPSLWRRSSHVPLPRLLLHCLDTAVIPLPARGDELLDPRQRISFLATHAQCSCVCLRILSESDSLVLVADRCSCVLVFVMPIGLANIGWKMYMVNGSWDIVIVVLIVSHSPSSSRFFYHYTHDACRQCTG